MIGQLISHYSPKAPARLSSTIEAGGDPPVADKILEKLGEARPPERRSRAGPNDLLRYLGGMNYGR